MSVRRVQFRRGSTAQHGVFTGAVGELTVNTDNTSVVVHDGTTAGGVEMARSDLDNLSLAVNSSISFADVDGDATVKITNVADPTNPQDVATRQYVLDAIGGGAVSLNALSDVTINAPANGHVIVYDADDGDGEWKNVVLSGDITMDKTGVTTIGNSKVTNAMLAGSIANNKLSNSSITFADADSNTSVALGGTITFQGVENETTVENVAGIYTIGLPDDVTIHNDLSVGRNLTITGNLTVNGQTTTVNSTTVSTQDVVIELASNADANLNATTDAGILITRGSTEAPAVMAWDEGDDKFILATAQGATGATTDFSGVGITLAYQPLKIGALEATADSTITASLTIQADNEDFLIKNSAGTTKFIVDSDSGNTSIVGTLNVDGNTTLSNVIIDNGSTITDINNEQVSFGNGGLTTTGNIDGADITATNTLSGNSITSTTSVSTSTLGVTTTSSLGGDVTIQTNASLKIEKADNTTDPLIIVNSDVIGASSDAKVIAVERGTSGADATISWDETNERWSLNNSLYVTGATEVTANLIVSGTTTLNNTLTMNTSNIEVISGLNTNFQVLANTGETTIEGLLNANGGIAVDTNKFTVTDGTGVTTLGTDAYLKINKQTTTTNPVILLNADRTGNGQEADVVAIEVERGALTNAQITWNETSDAWTIPNNIEQTGATTLSTGLGAISLNGATTISTTLDVTGITTLTGLLNANGGIAVNGGAFTVDTGTGNVATQGSLGVGGNTTITGTLGVTSTTTLSDTLNANGGLNVNGIASISSINGDITSNGSLSLLGSASVSGDLGVGGNTTITGTLGAGATTLNSTLDVTGVSTFSNTIQPNGVVGIGTTGNRWTNLYVGDIYNTNGINTSTINATGAVGITGLLTLSGGLTAEGFSIADDTGDTNISGTVLIASTTTMEDDLTIKNGNLGGNTFTVDAQTGDTHIVGITTLDNDLVMTGGANIDFVVKDGTLTSKFTIQSTTGNTDIQGTLNVVGQSGFNGAVNMYGTTNIDDDLQVTGTTTLQGLTATSFSTSATSITLNSDGGATDTYIYVERGANDPYIKWQASNNSWVFSGDGVTPFTFFDTSDTVFTATTTVDTPKNFLVGDTLSLVAGVNMGIDHNGNGTFTFNLQDDITINSLTVSGSALFDGISAYLNDPFLFLGNSNTSAVNHVGFYGRYDVGGTATYTGLNFNPSLSIYTLFNGRTGLNTATTSVTPTSSQLSTLKLGGITIDKANSSLTIQNGSAVTKFEVDSDNGDTTINGILNVSLGHITLASSEGSRYACSTPTFTANATTLSAPSTYVNKNAYFLTNGGNAGTVNLFALSGTTYDGYVIVFVNTDAATMTIDADGAQTINGSQTQNIVTGSTLTIIAKGTSWYII